MTYFSRLRSSFVFVSPFTHSQLQRVFTMFTKLYTFSADLPMYFQLYLEIKGWILFELSGVFWKVLYHELVCNSRSCYQKWTLGT